MTLFHVVFCLVICLSMFRCDDTTTETVSSNSSSTTSAPTLQTSQASTQSISQTNTEATSPPPTKSDVGCIGKIKRLITNCLKRKIRFIEGLPDLFWEVFCNSCSRNKQVIEYFMCVPCCLFLKNICWRNCWWRNCDISLSYVENQAIRSSNIDLQQCHIHFIFL